MQAHLKILKTISSEKTLKFGIRIAKQILTTPELYARVAPGIMDVVVISSLKLVAGEELNLRVLVKSSTLSGSLSVRLIIAETADSAQVTLIKGPFSIANGTVTFVENGAEETLVRLESRYATNVAVIDWAISQKLDEYLAAVCHYSEQLALTLA